MSISCDMMWVTLCILQLVIIPGYLTFHQTDYRIYHERIVVEWYNRSYIENFKYVITYHNRTTKTFDISSTVVREVGTDLKVITQAYKFLSNEYRQFPVLWSGNPCQVYEKNTFGTQNSWEWTNLTSYCPFKKGTFYIKGGYLDYTKLPPRVPHGRYMLDSNIYYKKTILLASFKWYGAVIEIVPVAK